MADDSGLEVDLLNKRPGIFSARWGGRKGDFNKAIKKVYKELSKVDKNWKNKKVKARFICVLSISNLDKKIACVQGKVKAIYRLYLKEKMDLVMTLFLFQNKKKTFGEMKPSQKYKIDHRFNAFKKIKNFFNFSIFNFIKI